MPVDIALGTAVAPSTTIPAYVANFRSSLQSAHLKLYGAPAGKAKGAVGHKSEWTPF